MTASVLADLNAFPVPGKRSSSVRHRGARFDAAQTLDGDVVDTTRRLLEGCNRKLQRSSQPTAARPSQLGAARPSERGSDGADTDRIVARLMAGRRSRPGQRVVVDLSTADTGLTRVPGQRGVSPSVAFAADLSELFDDEELLAVSRFVAPRRIREIRDRVCAQLPRRVLRQHPWRFWMSYCVGFWALGVVIAAALAITWQAAALELVARLLP